MVKIALFRSGELRHRGYSKAREQSWSLLEEAEVDCQ